MMEYYLIFASRSLLLIDRGRLVGTEASTGPTRTGPRPAPMQPNSARGTAQSNQAGPSAYTLPKHVRMLWAAYLATTREDNLREHPNVAILSTDQCSASVSGQLKRFEVLPPRQLIEGSFGGGTSIEKEESRCFAVRPICQTFA